MLSSLPLVRVAALRPIFQTLRKLGVPCERYVERADISPAVFVDPETFLPLRQASRCLTLAAAGERAQDLGLIAGQAARLEDLGTFGALIRRSRTVGDALECLVDVNEAFNSGDRWWLNRHGETVRLHHRYLYGLEQGEEQMDHYAISLVLNLLRLAGLDEWRPDEIRWQSAPARVVMQSSLFRGTRHGFGQPATTMMLPAALLDRPLARSVQDAPMPADVDAWRLRRPPGDLASSLREVIAVITPADGHPRIERTARALGMSVRTLQRRLKDQGLCFEGVTQEMRLGTAMRLLKETDGKILEIALDLGYSDHAHFTRAFRTWLGISPFEYRRRCRQKRGSLEAVA